MINKKLFISFILVCLCAFHTLSQNVTMVYPENEDRFVFETDKEHYGKRIRYVVNKSDVGSTENFKRMFVTVLQAQATGFGLWVGAGSVNGTHDGRPKAICTGLSINK